jgi:hypothetical protein
VPPRQLVGVPAPPTVAGIGAAELVGPSLAIRPGKGAKATPSGKPTYHVRVTIVPTKGDPVTAPITLSWASVVEQLETAFKGASTDTTMLAKLERVGKRLALVPLSEGEQKRVLAALDAK